MFTGIVVALGEVLEVRAQGPGRCLAIDLAAVAGVRVGDSLAVNGACLTVARLEAGVGGFDISAETLARTLIGDWTPRIKVNLEPALTLQTPLGGHLVSGHIDGVATVEGLEAGDGFTCMTLCVGAALRPFIAEKGSIAVDGVSLTLNSVADEGEVTRFDVMLVPHTLSHTTLGQLAQGHRVHIEIDQVVRYIQRLESCRRI